MKRRFFCIAAILILASVILCQKSRHPKEKPPFWIVTEKSNSDGMNYQLDQIICKIREGYPDLEMTVEFLPTESSAREIRLQQVRTQIMAGNGPDVYLLPTGNLLTIDEPSKGTEIPITPLFTDVSQAMRNGLFADISSYYDRDTGMNSAELNKVVMDAGCIGDKRFVLPLRYTVPILFLSSDDTYGEIDLSQMSAQSIVRYFLNTGNKDVACNIDLSKPFSPLPQLLDYEKGTVLISTEELTEYLRVYQEWKLETSAYQEQLFQEGNLRAVQSQDPVMQMMMSDNYYQIDYDSFGKLWCFLGLDVYWKSSGLPIYTGNMGNVIDLVAIKKALNSKKKLMQNCHYIPSAKDKDNNYVGSIFGCTIILKNDLPELELVKMILTITTYGREFVDKSKDELSVSEFEKLFKHNIINVYLKLIESEIAQMFVRHGLKKGYIDVHTGEFDRAKAKQEASEQAEPTPV